MTKSGARGSPSGRPIFGSRSGGNGNAPILNQLLLAYGANDSVPNAIYGRMKGLAAGMSRLIRMAHEMSQLSVSATGLVDSQIVLQFRKLDFRA